MGPRSIDCFCPTYCRHCIEKTTNAFFCFLQCLIYILQIYTQSRVLISELSFKKNRIQFLFLYSDNLPVYLQISCIISMCYRYDSCYSLHQDQILPSEINTVYNSMVMSLQDICISMYFFHVLKNQTQNTKRVKNNKSSTICILGLDKTVYFP